MDRTLPSGTSALPVPARVKTGQRVLPLASHSPAEMENTSADFHREALTKSPSLPSAAQALRDGSTLFPSMEALKASGCAGGEARGVTESTRRRARNEEMTRRCHSGLRSHNKANYKGRSHARRAAGKHACRESHRRACRWVATASPLPDGNGHL